ncbi:MAG: hypothetical protein Q8S84_04660 [bacterium]|nr:hypothetical protein [bacterium]
MNKISATNNQVIFESQIADQDHLNHIFIDSVILFQFLNSSFNLSNINIFASIAIQTDNISQATEAKVNTIPKDLTIAKTNNIYINKAIADINPDNL